MLIEAIILGIVQGITEFLPISSSAHLILMPWMFGWHGTLIDSLKFDVALHAGTLVAILAYFWRDWLVLLTSFFKGMGNGDWRTGEGRFVWYIVLATIPAGIVGFAFEHVIEQTFRDPLVIVGSLVLISIVMLAADRFSKKTQTIERMTLLHALFIGCAQALALVPGVSRSGITIVAGLLAGYTRESAARFSFLLSTPVIAGAAVLKLRHLGLTSEEIFPFSLGVLFSAIVGYLSIQFLLRYLARHSLNLFIGYRLALAGVVLALFIIR